MTKEQNFEEIVSAAIDNIPEPYSSKLENISFKVVDKPTQEERKQLGLRDCDALFGLYQGVPLTKRGGAVHSIVPDVITIFQHPMIDIFEEGEPLKRQVYETVWHEVAHYFGLNHDRIHRAKSKS